MSLPETMRAAAGGDRGTGMFSHSRRAPWSISTRMFPMTLRLGRRRNGLRVVMVNFAPGGHVSDHAITGCGKAAETTAFNSRRTSVCTRSAGARESRRSRPGNRRIPRRDQLVQVADPMITSGRRRASISRPGLGLRWHEECARRSRARTAIRRCSRKMMRRGWTDGRYRQVAGRESARRDGGG